MSLSKLSISSLAAGVLLSTSVAMAAPTAITLNPQATNGGAGAVSSTTSAYQVDNILGTLGSVLSIGGFGTTAPAAWSEVGQLVFTNGLLNSNPVLTGFNKVYGTGTYDIFGNFSGAGFGAWGTGFAAKTFLVGSIASFDIDLYAQVGGLNAANISSGGITLNANSIKLGKASFQSFAGITSASLLSGSTSGSASTNLVADFSFIPEAGFANTSSYTDGFFAAPIPFSLTINTSGSSNSGQSNYSRVGSNVTITTGATKVGTTNLTFATQAVPEPGALSLAAIALLGAAYASKRKKVASV
ncbi:MAG: hypothetical protein WCK08_14800 [Betaproteobacteria bacterium]